MSVIRITVKDFSKLKKGKTDHGPKGVAELLLGSETSKVLTHSVISVLV